MAVETTPLLSSSNSSFHQISLTDSMDSSNLKGVEIRYPTPPPSIQENKTPLKSRVCKKIIIPAACTSTLCLILFTGGIYTLTRKEQLAPYAALALLTAGVFIGVFGAKGIFQNYRKHKAIEIALNSKV